MTITVRKLIRSKRTRFEHHSIPLDEQGEQLRRELVASKLMEEAAELAKAVLDDDPAAILDEVVDIQEVVSLARSLGGHGPRDVIDARQVKHTEAGPLSLNYIERPLREGYKLVDLMRGIQFEMALTEENSDVESNTP